MKTQRPSDISELATQTQILEAGVAHRAGPGGGTVTAMRREEKLETLTRAANAWTTLAGAAMPGVHVSASDRNGDLLFTLSPSLNAVAEDGSKHAWHGFTMDDLRSFEELRDAVGPAMVLACVKMEDLVSVCHVAMGCGYSDALDEVTSRYLGADLPHLEDDREAAPV